MTNVLVAGLEEQRSATLAQLERVEDGVWTAPCLPPWRVRDVVAHLVAVDEAIVTGRMLVVLKRGDAAAVERWNDTAVLRLGALEPSELCERLQRRGARVRAITRGIPPVLDRLRLPTAYGLLSLRSLLCLRVVDEWVHTVDIAGATGSSAALRPSVPGLLATGALAILPGVALPRVRRPVGVLRLEVGVGSHGEWHGDRRYWGIDFARRQYGPRVRSEPDATVSVHASTLALLVHGRVTWREALPGSLLVEGDEEVAAGLLDVLQA